jgi:hypothetical protein
MDILNISERVFEGACSAIQETSMRYLKRILIVLHSIRFLRGRILDLGYERAKAS